MSPMKILFLHGWKSTSNGLKPTYLREHGLMSSTHLPEDDFGALKIFQAEFDQGKPDVLSTGSHLAVSFCGLCGSNDTPARMVGDRVPSARELKIR